MITGIAVKDMASIIDALIKARIRLDLMGTGVIEHSEPFPRVEFEQAYNDALTALAEALVLGVAK